MIAMSERKFEIKGPYPPCPKCQEGILIPVKIEEDGAIIWRCSRSSLLEGCIYEISP